MTIQQIIAGAHHGRSAAQGSTTTLRHSEADALEAALADMTASFSHDFANGLMGVRRETHEHRSRVLRQMTGKLALLRAGDAIPRT